MSAGLRQLRGQAVTIVSARSSTVIDHRYSYAERWKTQNNSSPMRFVEARRS